MQRPGHVRPLRALGGIVYKPAKRRARPKARAVPHPGVNLDRLAEGATYVGSPEHKGHPSSAGPARKRSDATPCPRNVNFDHAQLTQWVRTAIAAGNVTEPWEQGMYPRYAWLRVGDAVWMARAVNAQQGTYKGWQATAGEVPAWLG